ncbi:sterol desaturase family protein [Rhodonellum sp.]|uniref:sterol desaturase family protein n=1 Tax=Rhodonellum sp. TaxID=2231180 RepID=UPI00271D1B77|nr:sterol desaturase family protein [Rhodonellum sp.]MDO9554259.1 sterol desaturase family protein [Rhodonellum sp.]
MENSKNPFPLFSNPLLEKFSRTNAWLVIISLTLLSLSVFAYGFIQVVIPIQTKAATFLMGFLFFTLAEYLIHRFVFHAPGYSNKKNWIAQLHGIHHAHPTDKKRLTLPLSVAIGVSSIVFFFLWALLGQYAWFFFPGFILGYAFYLFVHYLIHTRRPPKGAFEILWKNHYIHHYRDANKAFGVTTPFWDHVFRTMPENPNRY